MRHSTPEEQEAYRNMLSRHSIRLFPIGDLTADDIYLVLDLLDMLSYHSEGYSEMRDEWFEDVMCLQEQEEKEDYEKKYAAAIAHLKELAENITYKDEK